MSTNFLILSASESLGKASAKMDEFKMSCVLVAENGGARGIITERDIVSAIIKNLNPDVAVSQIMSNNPISVDVSTEVHEAYHLMLVNNIHHLVVIDDTKSAVGVLTETDFRNYKGLENFIAFPDVSSAMNRESTLVLKHESVASVASVMHTNHVDYAVVIDGNAPTGLVTTRDIIQTFMSNKLDTSVNDVMSSSLITVKPDDLLINSAKLMRDNGIRRLIVINDDGQFVGTLNEHDIIKNMESEYVDLLQDVIKEQARKIGEENYHAVINQISHRVLVKDLGSNYVSCNESYAHDLGVDPEIIKGKTDFDFFPRELAERYRNDDRKVIESGIRIDIEEPYTINGNARWVATSKSPLRGPSGEITGVVVVLSDITDRKEAEEGILRLNRALKALSASNEALVYAESEQELIESICKAITFEDTYELAWIGWKIDDIEKTVSIIAASGHAKEYAKDLKVSWGDNQSGHGPSGIAIRTNEVYLENDFCESQNFQPWRERAKIYGLRSSTSLPIRINGDVAGVISIYSDYANAFSDSAIKLFQELVINLSYGIEARRTKIAYNQAIQDRELQSVKLEHALNDSLMAIASTLEQRDPYTAGHEKGVADIAVSIGKKLGWDDGRLKGLYLAGIVHDLGKIQIPVEILTKPGRLNQVEFSLIKTHPEVGYNILKNIEYPWPIAEIVRQHHEYLDGSGYPRGLVAEQILDEAKVLTVADIFESMSSARPYRPALGKEHAIEEIKQLRGVKLDPRVVDALLKIF